MKPKTLLKQIGRKINGCDNFYNNGREILEKYENEDCIIAYSYYKAKELFFIIKGKNKFFAFRAPIILPDLERVFRRESLSNIFKTLKSSNFKIINKKEFEKIKSEIIFEGLK